MHTLQRFERQYEERQQADWIMHTPRYPLFQHDAEDCVFYQADCSGWLAVACGPRTVGLLPVEGFPHLEIPVANFQETERFQIPWARCTGPMAFHNHGSRNHWVLVQTCGEANYGALWGCVVAQLLAHFKIWNILSEAAAVYHLALVYILDPINSGRFHIRSNHVQVGNRINDRYLRIVSIEAVMSQAHVIPIREKQYIENPRIDLSKLNAIY